MEKQAMTPQEKLHAVETAIRKALPRLQEPTEGCWFKSGYGEEKLINVGGENDDKFLFIDVFKNHYEADEVPKIYEIIGHDILLSDVLEWLAREHNNIEILLTNNGIILINFREDKPNRVVIDLSKPYLKDQSEELINFLYNLLEDNE